MVNPKYHIETFGCQMNEHDSERLSGMLEAMGYSWCDDVNASDLIIYNTCCVRDNAEKKIYGHLGALKQLKISKPHIVLAICGCMTQQQGVVEKIKRTYRHVDIVFGTHNLHKFPEYLYTLLKSRKLNEEVGNLTQCQASDTTSGGLNEEVHALTVRESHKTATTKVIGERVMEVWQNDGRIVDDMPIRRTDRVKAWVTVMYGCNNYCSYCIVPYVRGRERSRRVESIVEEVKILGAEGFKEITLLGQNVNSYGKDLGGNESFANLLRELNGVQGIERIRFTTSHPKDLSDELITAMRDLSKVCKHLHLPFQAGSNKVLHAMNRKYTKEQYIDLINKIKTEVPGIVFTTDIIVGFPGEEEEDFKETLNVLETVRFDNAYMFLYSKRTGTPAAQFENQIPESVMKERFSRLLEVQNRISKEINDTLLGEEVEVLVEGLSKSNDCAYTGRTYSNKVVNFLNTNGKLIGDIVKVRINSVKTWSLEGTI